MKMPKNQNENKQVQQQIQQDAEPKTVVNGKVVPVNQARASEELFMEQNNQTGIQSHHNNQSESVMAGRIAQQNNQNLVNARQHIQQAQNYINHVNLQSGQQHLEQYMQQAQQMIQQANDQMQQAQKHQSNNQGTQGMVESVANQVEDHQEIQGTLDEESKAKTKSSKTK